MTEKTLEREDKYDVSMIFQLPDFADLVPAGGRCDRRVIRLQNDYYDTDDYDLLRNGIVLRRRTGDEDTGWQLKLPKSQGVRAELRVDNREGAHVPDELAELLLGVRRGMPLRLVATLHTERTIQRLCDSDGAVLVEIADDEVRATALGESVLASQWHEVEAELKNGSPTLLKDIRRRLLRHGATRSAAPSKLSKALQHRPELEGHRPRQRKQLAGLVTAYLEAQYEALLQGDLALRQGEDEIHRTRVACRRYRSTLRTGKSLFDSDKAAALDSELAWFAAALGGVRDGDVLYGRLRSAVEELPPDLVLGPVAATIQEYLLTRQAAARRELANAMSSQRYLDLLDVLAHWHEQPPLTELADRSAKKVRSILRRAERRADKEHAKALRLGHDPVAFHRSRKAAKRARYAAELAEPALAGRARKSIKKYKKLQTILGEHQDCVVAADVVKRIAIETAPDEHQNGFSYGLLYERLQREAARARERADR
jgi:CHAD domain-containing protein